MKKCIVICRVVEDEKLIDEEVEEFKYVLFHCFGYFEKYFTTNMKTEEKPIIYFPAHIFRTLVHSVFHQYFSSGSSGNSGNSGDAFSVKYDDIDELYQCALFLSIKMDTHIFVGSVMKNASGVITQSLAEFIKQSNIELDTELIEKLCDADIASLLIVVQYESVINRAMDKFSDERCYEIFKLSNYGTGMYWDILSRIAKFFTVTDFLEIYNYMSTESVGTPNIKKFIDVIGVLAECDHLYYEPQLTKHMKFIRTCLVIRC